MGMASMWPASVIVMSLGWPEDISLLHSAIQYAVSSGVLVMCAADNEGDNSSETDEYAYHAGYLEVVSMGAFNLDWMEPTGYSNSNAELGIVATPGRGYIKMSSTTWRATCGRRGSADPVAVLATLWARSVRVGSVRAAHLAGSTHY